YRNSRIQRKVLIRGRRTRGHEPSSALVGIQFRRGKGEMPGIDSDGKIRTTALFIRLIYGSIQTRRKMRADRRHQMSARRKSEDSNLARVDMPLRGVRAHKPHRALRIFQRDR